MSLMFTLTEGTTTTQLLEGREPDADGYWSCPVEGCEKGPFKGKGGIAMHLSNTHGAIGQKKMEKARGLPEPTDPDSVTAQVRTQLRELTAPLREQSAEIDQRLVAIAREQRDLREAKRQIESVLSKLEASPAQKMRPVSNGSEARGEDRRKAVEEFVTAHRQLLEDGFTMNSLCETMKENGAMALTSKTMRPVVETLRDAGILRADRVIRGGGMAYQVV